jgi:hypothetical protein
MAEQKAEVIDYSKMSPLARLQKVREEISGMSLKKSGKNKYSGFTYFELRDFLPQANKLFAKYGLCPVFDIGYEQLLERSTDFDGESFSNVEYAYLDVCDAYSDAVIPFKTPTAENVIRDKMGKISEQNPIQNLGAKKTYLKRYLYLDVLELSEDDAVDPEIGNPDVPSTEDSKAPTKKTIIPTEPKKADKTETTSDDPYLSEAHKIEITQMIVEKGLDIIETMNTVGAQLKTDKAQLRESQRDQIIEIIGGLK